MSEQQAMAVKTAFLAACGYGLDGERLSVQERVSRVAAAEQIIPGVGWASAATHLEEWWEKHPPDFAQERMGALVRDAMGGAPF